MIHAVSAGEMAAAEALVARWQSFGGSVVLTTGNPDGWAKAAGLQAAWQVVEAIAWMPWDRARAMERWLREVQPAAVAVVETEIWPNLFAACGSLGIPLSIVSGRLAPRDVTRYRLARPFFAAVLANARWIGAQSLCERRRFLAIGAAKDRVEVVGNLKLDVPCPPPSREMPLREPLLLGACTHAPEEQMLLDLLPRLRDSRPGLRLALVPRKVDRAAAIARQARRRGHSFELVSRSPSAGADVEIVDRIGGLQSWYRRAEIVVLGGSFASRGGHSPVEALAAGRPLVVGPHTELQEDLIAMLVRKGGLLQVSSEEELAPALETLLRSSDLRSRLAAKGRGIVCRDHGVADLTCNRLASFVQPAS